MLNICQLRFNVWYVSYPLVQLKRLRKLNSPLISKNLKSTSLHDLYEAEHYEEYDNM